MAHLCVNMTRLRDTQTAGKHCFWVYLWERFTFELVGWVKQMAFSSVGGQLPIFSGPE